MNDGMIDGFERRKLPGHQLEIDALVGGSGPPLLHQGGPDFVFPEENVEDYVACAQDPAVVHAWCEDYRAGWGVDRRYDAADRGRKLPIPLLILWGERGSLAGKDAIKLWRPWSEQVEGEMLPGGHFIPEEQPQAVVSHFRRFFAS